MMLRNLSIEKTKGDNFTKKRLVSIVFVMFLTISAYASSKDITFKLTFEKGLKPDTAISKMAVQNKGAVIVSGKSGKAVRVGRKGDAFQTAGYFLKKESIDAEESGKKDSVFPLRRGKIEFDFRPAGWKIGDFGTGYIVRIIGKRSSNFSVRYIMHKEKPCLQLDYGMLHEKYKGGKRPRCFMFTEIKKEEDEHWYHVSIAWNMKEITLSVDGSKKTGDLNEFMLPEYNGMRLLLGRPHKGAEHVQMEGFFDIDNLVMSSVPEEKKAGNEDAHFPKAVIGRCSEKINIDGKLDEKSWQESTLIRGFMGIRKNQYSVHQPKVYLTYDNKNLYIGIESPLHGRKDLTAKAVNRDDPVWKDDCIELFLDPTPETIDFYQIVINSRGVIFDEVCNAGNVMKKYDRSCNLKDMKTKANVGEKYWILEVSIPFKDIGVEQVPEGKYFLFNVCETRGGLGAFSICSVRHGYLDRERHGMLLFRNDLPKIRLGDLGPIKSGLAKFIISYSGQEDKKVEFIIKGEQYDETADTYFGLFSKSFLIDATPKTIFEADETKLKKNGVIRIKAKAEDEIIYQNNIGYETVSKIEIESMRIVREKGRKQLKVRTCQPFVGEVGKDTARISLIDEKGKVIKKTGAKVTAEKMDLYLDIKNVPRGEYEVAMELKHEDGSLKKADELREFVVYPDPPPWHNNKLGISDKVPPPWAPLKVSKRRRRVIVKCWNREYYFGSGSLLPEQIVSGGEKYLKGPIEVLLKSGIRFVNMNKVTHKVTKKSGKTCKIKSVCNTSWGRIQTETTIEFDGFIWVDLNLNPIEQVKLNDLKLVWKMPAEKSILLHPGYRSLQGVGKTPKNWNKNLNQFQGPFWVGDENGGISFAVENFKGWSNKNTSKQAELNVAGDETQININIVDKPITIDKNTTYGFCFHPTPVRPRPVGYRKLRRTSWMSKLRGKMKYPITLSDWNHTAPHQGAPDWATTDEELKEWCQKRKRKYDSSWFSYRGLKESGTRSTWYATYSDSARNTPEFIWSGENWKTTKADRLYGDSLRGYSLDLVNVCKTNDYRDYYLWRFDKTKKEHPVVDGIYYDLMGWKGCDREDHGHGYRDDKENSRLTWEIRDHRKWTLRVYTYLKEKDPDTPVMFHLSGQTPKIMGYSFGDYLLDGELWIEEIQKDKSYKNVSLAAFRTMLSGQIWGPAVCWISQLNRALNYASPAVRKQGLEPWAYRHLLAVLLVHDSSPPIAGLTGSLDIWKIMDGFGLDDKDRMLPYWETGTGIELDPRDDNVAATAYVKSDRALIVVFNNTDKDLNVKVEVDTGKIFGAAGRLSIIDSEKEKEIAGENIFSLPVGRRNFRLLTVKQVSGD